MGVMKFLVPRREHFAADAPERAYLAGLDEIPWQSRARWTDAGFEIERAESDSGNLCLPCSVPGHGELMLLTTSLMERARPYHLAVELARGTVHRMRNQIAAMATQGIALPAATLAQVSQAMHSLAGAATRQLDVLDAGERAIRAITEAVTAINSVNEVYASAILAARHKQAGRLHTLLGVNLGSTRPSETFAPALKQAFNTALVPMSWRDIEAHEGRRDWSLSDAQLEWCRAQGWKICGGPLLALDKGTLPDWMYLWSEDEEDSFRSCVAEQIQAVVSRYRGKVQLWMASARLNRQSDFAQSEEERLRLAVLTIETIRRIDARTPIVISIDQPWGAFMSHEECELSPLHFADALVRANLSLSGIALEINLGYAPPGTEPRDPIELTRQIERFGSLGLPLLLALSVPSAGSKDVKARQQAAVLPYLDSNAPTPAGQSQWVERMLPLMLTKPAVQGILWNQLQDAEPHAFPHGGLFDDRDRPKPLVEALQNLRKQHLM